MKKLKQNNLSMSTSDIGFVKTLNENAEELSSSKIFLQREVELDSGEIVIVEGVTPELLKGILNEQSNSAITYQTPGENYGQFKGVAQLYNRGTGDNPITIYTKSIGLFVCSFDTEDIEIAYNDIAIDKLADTNIGAITFGTKLSKEINVEILECDCDSDWHVSTRIYVTDHRVSTIPNGYNHSYSIRPFNNDSLSSIKNDYKLKFHLYDEYNSTDSGILSVIEYPGDEN